MGLGRSLAGIVATTACSTLLVLACGFDGVGAGPSVDEAGTSSTGDGSTTSTTDAAAGTDGQANVDANVQIPTAKSCKEILAGDPSRLGMSGPYSGDLYCDMELDGGGWTLVGRSAPNGTGPFGWRSAAGSIADLSKPFSMNVVAAGLAFSEVMISDRDPTVRAYTFAVAPDFIAAHADDRIPSGTLTKLLGPCTPSPVISMLKFIGATALTDTFFFRDLDDLAQHRGLRANGWDLAYDNNCLQGALLDGEQGSIFVR